MRNLLVCVLVIAGHASSVVSIRLARADDAEPEEKYGVYAKIVLPMKLPAAGTCPVVESWIAKKLRKRGNTELRAVTDWIRLTEQREASVWDATVDGKTWGCPVLGRVMERTKDGQVKVRLTGWSPAALDIEEWTVPDEMGSRRIIEIETGAADGSGRAYVALFVGPPLAREVGSR